MTDFRDDFILKAGKASSFCDYKTSTNLYIQFYEPDYYSNSPDLLLSSATFYIKEKHNKETIYTKIGTLTFYRAPKIIPYQNLLFLFDQFSADMFNAAVTFSRPLNYYDVYIHKIFILEEYRKQGYGSQIIDWLSSYSEHTSLIFFQTKQKEHNFLKEFYIKSFKYFSLSEEKDGLLIFKKN